MNKWIGIGRITAKPEVQYSPSGTAICKFTVAVDRQSKDGGADFIRVTAFGKQAETIARYMDKGRQIAIEGTIQTGSYEKDGKKIYTQDVIINHAEFLGSAKNTEEPKPTEEQVRQLEDDVANLFSLNATDDDCPF